MDINKWLDTPPKDEEVATNADGSLYIPIGIVEQLLDDMTGSTWATRNFSFSIVADVVCGSVELYFPELNRSMVGSKTFSIDEYPDNQDWTATLLSECIKNAAKKLGRRFGRELNGRVEKQQSAKIAVKMKPDAKIMQKYLAAIASGDEVTANTLVSMYEIKIG